MLYDTTVQIVGITNAIEKRTYTYILFVSPLKKPFNRAAVKANNQMRAIILKERSGGRVR